MPVGGLASPSVGGPATFLVGATGTLSLGGLDGPSSPLTGEVHPGSDSRVHHHGDSLGEEEKMEKLLNFQPFERFTRSLQ